MKDVLLLVEIVIHNEHCQQEYYPSHPKIGAALRRLLKQEYIVKAGEFSYLPTEKGEQMVELFVKILKP